MLKTILFAAIALVLGLILGFVLGRVHARAPVVAAVHAGRAGLSEQQVRGRQPEPKVGTKILKPMPIGRSRAAP